MSSMARHEIAVRNMPQNLEAEKGIILAAVSVWLPQHDCPAHQEKAAGIISPSIDQRVGAFSVIVNDSCA